MCGIAGFTGFTDNRSLAEAAGRIQAHRGPDNQTVWSDHLFAFAHQRLSIIDLSEAANQPFHKGDHLIVFNGEIYNYKELQSKLQKEKGVVFKTSSDTEVALEMYLQYGEDCVNQFTGMFAFGVYHKLSGRLFLARDHFGIKPLFYTRIGHAFAFSSELKALTGLPGFNKTINADALVSALNYLWVAGNETMFRDCYKLPPAHTLTLDPDKGPVIRKYWDVREQPRQVIGETENQIADTVANAFEAAVARHMVADVPVSSFLSGGLDSSLIAVLAQKHNKQLSTYTIATTEEDKKVEQMPDDARYARKLADSFGFDHHEIVVNTDIIKEFPAMVYTLDEPIGDPAAINTYLICKAARERGVKVLLSGMGADEVFSGYRRHKATLLAIRFRKWPALLRKLAATVVSWLPVKVMGRGFRLGRWAKRFMSFAELPPGDSYMRSYSYYDKKELADLLTADYKPAVEQVYAEHEALFQSGFTKDPVNQLCHTDIHMFLLGLNLTYSDRASMAASVEVRVPFIDKEMISLAMAIPGKWKQARGQSKYILKKAAERYLPHDIIYRPKASFGAPIRSWISGDLVPMVDDLLSKENVEKRGFLNYGYVKKMIEDDRNGTHDYAYQIYQFCTLELWCRNYLDDPKK